LYYFEGDHADTPRGVIDLHYYTDITADGNNTIKVRRKSFGREGGGSRCIMVVVVAVVVVVVIVSVMMGASALVVGGRKKGAKIM